VSPKSPFQGLGDRFRMSDDLTQILPDQVIELLDWAKAGAAFFFLAAVSGISFGGTDIITRLALEMTRRTGGQALATIDQSPQEIVIPIMLNSSRGGDNRRKKLGKQGFDCQQVTA
jgi:hypothetical protein